MGTYQGDVQRVCRGVFESSHHDPFSHCVAVYFHAEKGAQKTGSKNKKSQKIIT